MLTSVASSFGGGRVQRSSCSYARIPCPTPANLLQSFQRVDDHLFIPIPTVWPAMVEEHPKTVLASAQCPGEGALKQHLQACMVIPVRSRTTASEAL